MSRVPASRRRPTSRAETGVTVRVPAKLNLQLAVGPLRPDGYHGLATLFHAVSLFDDVTVTPADRLSITVDGAIATDVPTGPDNLAARAATLLGTETGHTPTVHIHIRKGIPVAGGMAGGSADAAAALVACDALWGTGLPEEELRGLGARLGSDVPFALLGWTAVGHGRGERLTPALSRGTFHWVFALDDEGLSTPKVYAECDRLRAGSEVAEPRISEDLMEALLAGDTDAVGAGLSNDLQAAAVSLRPKLARTLEVGLANGALGAVVSGSGPTCAFLVRDPEAALDLAVVLSAEGTCRWVRRASGPVHGARVV